MKNENSKNIPVFGSIIKCINTRNWFEHADPSLSMMTKNDKFKVIMAYESDMTGNNYNAVVMPLSEKYEDHRINLKYRVDTGEFSYYHKNTLYAVFKKEETFRQLLNFKPTVGDTVYHVIGEKVTKQIVYLDSSDNTLMVKDGNITSDEGAAILVSNSKNPVKIFPYTEKWYNLLPEVYGKDSVPKYPTNEIKRRIDIIDSLFKTQDVVIVLLDNKPVIAQDLFADNCIKINDQWFSFHKHDIIPVDYNLNEITEI